MKRIIPALLVSVFLIFSVALAQATTVTSPPFLGTEKVTVAPYGDTILFLGDSMGKAGLNNYQGQGSMPLLLKGGVVNGIAYFQNIFLDSVPLTSQNYILEYNSPGASSSNPIKYNFGRFPSTPNATNYFYRTIVTLGSSGIDKAMEGQTLRLFGKDYIIGSTSTDTFTGASTDKLVLYSGEASTVISGTETQKVTVDGIEYDITMTAAQNLTSAVIKVGSDQQSITKNSAKKIGGLYVYLSDVYFLSQTDQTQNSAKLFLGIKKMTLQNGYKVKTGDYEDTVDGTYVKFLTENGKLSIITIYVGGRSINEDYLAEGGYYLDPVWGAFYINFPSVTENQDGTVSANIEIVGNAQATTTQTCMDSDGGKNYYTYGKLTWQGINANAPDFCYGNNLYEYYCDGNNQAYEIYSCPNGCSGGACVQVPPLPCGDSDDGKNYYTPGKGTGFYSNSQTKGAIFGEDRNKASYRGDSTLPYSIYYDHCYDSATSNQLNEAFCDSNGLLQAYAYQCPNGCKDGACVRPSMTCTDTDGGINYYVKGYGSGYHNGTYVNNTYDSCLAGPSLTSSLVSSSNYLGELYCDSNNLEGTVYTCPNGCSKGACLQQSTAITLLTPNGGETFIQTDAGQTTANYIKWSGGPFSAVHIFLTSPDYSSTVGSSTSPPSYGVIWGGEPTSTNEISWDAKTVCQSCVGMNCSNCSIISPGFYKIYIVGDIAGEIGQAVTDLSDAKFTIVSVTNTSCVPLGGTGPNPSLGPNDPNANKACCSGLMQATPKRVYSENCQINMVGYASTCIKCGDGVCDTNYESKCNCPKDCTGTECTSDNDCKELVCPGSGFVHEICESGKCVLRSKCPTATCGNVACEKGYECVNAQCIAKSYISAGWICYDGAGTGVAGQCSSYDTYSEVAMSYCSGHCNSDNSKCGVSSLTMGNECPTAVCGNGVCETGESNTCPQDCSAYKVSSITTDKKYYNIKDTVEIKALIISNGALPDSADAQITMPGNSNSETIQLSKATSSCTTTTSVTSAATSTASAAIPKTHNVQTNIPIISTARIISSGGGSSVTTSSGSGGGGGQPCPAVCRALWEIKDGVCKYNSCGSGCGPDGTKTFSSETECKSKILSYTQCSYTGKFTGTQTEGTYNIKILSVQNSIVASFYVMDLEKARNYVITGDIGSNKFTSLNYDTQSISLGNAASISAGYYTVIYNSDSTATTGVVVLGSNSQQARDILAALPDALKNQLGAVDIEGNLVYVFKQGNQKYYIWTSQNLIIMFTASGNTHPEIPIQVVTSTGQMVVTPAQTSNVATSSNVATISNVAPATSSQVSTVVGTIKGVVSSSNTRITDVPADILSAYLKKHPSDLSGDMAGERYTLYLKKGWNLISVPSSVTGNSLVSQPTDCVFKSSLWAFNRRSQNFERNSNLLGYSGAWIKVDKDCTISIPSNTENSGDLSNYFSNAPQLKKGWNTIGGLPSQVQVSDISGCMFSRGPFEFNAATNKWEKATYMESGKAYGAYISSDCQMLYQEETPPNPPDFSDEI